MAIKTNRLDEMQLDQAELTSLVQNYLSNKFNGTPKEWAITFEKSSDPEQPFTATGVRQTKF